MPSLPSLPPFDDDSADDESLSSSNILGKLKDTGDDDSNKSIDMSLDITGPAHSTPAPSSHYASTIRATSSVSSTARFAHSIASRSAKSASLGLSGNAGRTSLGRTSRGSVRRGEDEMSMDSFDASVITSLPVVDPATETDEGDLGTVEISKDGTQEESISVPEVYLPPEEPEEHGLSFADALATVNESREHTPKKFMEYSVNLRSEPKVSLTSSLSTNADYLIYPCSLLQETGFAMLLFEREKLSQRGHELLHSPAPLHHPIHPQRIPLLGVTEPLI